MSRKPTWKYVESELIEAVWYNRNTKVLHIKFTTGSYYIYREVSYHRYRRLMSAESKGKYFIKYIRLSYVYKKIK